MRQIGTIQEEVAARALADYLLTRGIETKLTSEAAGWELWICDEDRVGEARTELAAFLANPRDPRYSSAGRKADEIRRAEVRADELVNKRQIALAEKMSLRERAFQPITGILIGLCSLIALVTQMGEKKSPLTQTLYITALVASPDGSGFLFNPTLPEIRSGQVWRLITPIFLHFSLWHIVGNMMWLYYLGNQIEARRGSLRFLGLVLIIAALSNLTEYYLGGLTLENGHLTSQYHPNFGGMSGVVFGLFGYVWMKMRFEPGAGMGMSQQNFMLSLFWLVFCMTGLAGLIANGAHVGGLVGGTIIGAFPALFRR